MTTTLDQRRQIISSLRTKTDRDLFVETEIETGTAIQVHALREQEGWTQAELADRAGMRQARISLLESLDYEGSVNVKTLVKLAAAFDVALMVRFVPFSELVDWATNLSDERLAVPKYTNDTRLHAMVDESPVTTQFEREWIPTSSICIQDVLFYSRTSVEEIDDQPRTWFNLDDMQLESVR